MRSLSRLLRCIPALVLSAFAVPAIAQAPSLVSIPEALRGIYQLEITDVPPLSPLQNTNLTDDSDDILLYLSSIGELCIKSPNSAVEVLSNQPQLQYGIFNKVSWDIADLAMRFTLDIAQNNFAGIDITSLGGTSFGRLTGTRIDANDSGSCRTSTFDSKNTLNIINAAEVAYPAYFPKSALSVNQIGDGFDLYRYYPTTKVYLAVKDNTVFARGGAFGVDYAVIGYVDELSSSISNIRLPTTNSQIEFFQGTYLLELTDALAVSPIPDGTQINLVVGDGGLLCVGEKILAFPSIASGIDPLTGDATLTATWSDRSASLRYVLDLNRNEAEDFGVGEFFLQSTNGNTYGLFAGDQISVSKECSGAQGTDPDLASKNNFFSLIEAKYPTLFPSGPQTFNQTKDGFTYRYYFASQIYVGIKNNIVYANGGQFGFNVNPMPVGALSALSSQLNDASIGHNFPTTSAGTYSMVFSGATVYSPFADANSATVVFDANGSLCLNGSSLGAAVSKSSSPNTAVWENSDLGLKFSVDTSNISGNDISISVASTADQAYSTLSGTRTSIETTCGTSTTALSIAKANQLFSLAEQYYPQYFPSNLLSVNQLSGNSVHRFYQPTGMFLSIVGQDVSVRGGPFGSSYVGVGNIDTLSAQIILDNTPVVPTTPTPATPVYDLRITGSGEVSVLSTTLYPKVDMKKYAVVLPDSNVDSELTSFVRTSFASTLPTIDSISVYSITSTSSQLQFYATVSNTTSIGSTKTTRSYDLVYTFTKR